MRKSKLIELNQAAQHHRGANDRANIQPVVALNLHIIEFPMYEMNHRENNKLMTLGIRNG